MKLSAQDRKLANYLCEFPMIHSVPFYFGNPERDDSKVNNGTATLLKRGEFLYVVTNHHVFAKFYARQESEEGVTLQIGGLNVDTVSDRVMLNDEGIDVCVLDMSGYGEEEFRMFGNVPTQFHELGDIPEDIRQGKVVAFGGFPGSFRDRVGTNEVNFHTFSSGASVVEEITDRNIIVNIDHSESLITSLSDKAPPADVGGMSGGPVFLFSAEGRIATFGLAGIISECNENLSVMMAKPVQLFAHVFH